MNLELHRTNKSDFEQKVRMHLTRSPEQQIKEMREALENINLIALAYGTKAPSFRNDKERQEQATSALDTISHIANQAIFP